MSLLSQALSGVKVLDLSQGIAGPHAGCLLAEMGAEVIKVEPPGGDWLRVLGVRKGQSSVLFATFNRGKRGVVLNLKDPEGLQAVRDLIAQADILLENSRVGVMRRLGLDYETAKVIKPDLVYVSVTGFGQDGPYAQRPATDAAVQAYTGFSFGAGDMVQPIRVRLSLADIITGIYASQAAVAALLQRYRTGAGQHVDIALMHGLTAVQGYKYAEYALTGGKLQDELFAGIGIYPTADGFIALSAMKEAHVEALIRIVNRVELLTDPRFGTAEGRFANQAALRQIFTDAFRQQPTAHWLPQLQEADLIHQEVLNYDAYRRDPQVRARALFTEVDLGEIGVLPVVRMPGLTPGEAPTAPAPSVGEHTEQVLSQYGFEPARVARLLEQQIQSPGTRASA